MSQNGEKAQGPDWQVQFIHEASWDGCLMSWIVKRILSTFLPLLLFLLLRSPPLFDYEKSQNKITAFCTLVHAPFLVCAPWNTSSPPPFHSPATLSQPSTTLTCPNQAMCGTHRRAQFFPQALLIHWVSKSSLRCFYSTQHLCCPIIGLSSEGTSYLMSSFLYPY